MKKLEVILILLLVIFISCSEDSSNNNFESFDTQIASDSESKTQNEITEMPKEIFSDSENYEIVLPKLPIIIEDPLNCGCSSEFDTCLKVDLPSSETQKWCTKKCDPNKPFLCDTLFDQEACCLKIPTENNFESAFCFPKEQCCKNCGELCCLEVMKCVNNGEMCWPEFLKQCGDSFCLLNEVCVEGVCCPKTLSGKCGPKCVSQTCDCIDKAKGICLEEGETFCEGFGICKSKEKCIKEESKNYCLPEELISCGDEFCHSKYLVCTPIGCCLKETPIGCGKKCCYPEPLEKCIINEVCLPKDHQWCNGQICSPGFKCSDDKKTCYPEKGDYCGDGKYCSDGMWCAQIGCCLQGQKEISGQCYPGYYECQTGPKGEVCYPPTSEYCYETGNVCENGKYCAKNDTLCLDWSEKVCPDGHICPGNLQCAGSTCCEFGSPNNCGNLCCPDYWQCKKNSQGQDICIPTDAVPCQNSDIWCKPPYVCASDGQCMHYTWTDCGGGLKCNSDKICAKDGNNKKCCLEGQPKLCGDACCYPTDQCVKDGDQSFCLPQSAKYCGIFNGEKKWCSLEYYCGKKELNKGKCIPDDAQECDNSGFCLSGSVCINSDDGTSECCGIGDPLCLLGAKCEKNSDCITGSWESWLSCLPKKLGSAEKYCMQVKQGSFCDDFDVKDKYAVSEDCEKLYKGTPCINGVCGREYWADCLEKNPDPKDFVDKCRCLFDKECAPGLKCIYISSGATCSEISVCGCPDSGNYLSSSCISGQSCKVDKYGIYKDIGVLKNDVYATEIYFIDSGEGTDTGMPWNHGPTGNMHTCLTDPENEPPTNLPVQPPGSISVVCLPGTEIGHLPGPHPIKCEWYPNMGLLCQSFTLFNWDNYEKIIKEKYPKCNSPTGLDILFCFEKINKAIIIIWESDTCSPAKEGWYCDIPFFGWIGCAIAGAICDEKRADDIMGAEIVKKNEITGQCGKKVLLHRYTDGGDRTDTISGWIRIKIKQ